MLLFKYSDEDLVSALDELQSSHRGTDLEKHYGDFRHVTENDKIEGQGINECACKETDNVHYNVSLDGNKSGYESRIKFPIIPPEGITLKHIRTGEDLQVPRRLVAIFLVLTMADFIDQLYSWQDSLFENEDGRLEFRGNTWTALWPGDGKPGLWMTAISRMGVLLNILVKEEELERQFSTKTNANGHDASLQGDFLDVKLVIPPIFNKCSVILPSLDQIKARDLYWEAVCMDIKERSLEEAEGLLLKACNCNPWIGEPYLLLAQIYLSKGWFEVALANAKEGLRLLMDWGTNWDKRMSWEGWVAWARVLELNARENTWPKSSWGMINLGLVK
ncbi:hypothetical protein O6H91_08G049300 [Diphasiastrum complanatum]|nr:hypothetical protein O6H91_08G048500 [Diphasiastrum complanatum]KAJ7546661.1 hypothetical protein O6H91_08G049300 [Diphasiastrum complanatum]